MTEPPPENGLGPTGGQPRSELDRSKNERTTRKISEASSVSKCNCRSTLADVYLPGYLRFLSRELRGRDASSTAWKFLSEAKRRYKQFSRSGDIDLRRLTWSAIQLCARQLEKEEAQ
jgi:hypothetical protein